MNDCIERKKAIELIQPHVKPQTVYGEGYLQAIEHATDILELMPAADVQPVKRGRWAKDEKGTFHHCSECGGESFRDVDCLGLEYQEYCTDYCPHCGARMDGGTDDENS